MGIIEAAKLADRRIRSREELLESMSTTPFRKRSTSAA